jgi:hypothetical protein
MWFHVVTEHVMQGALDPARCLIDLPVRTSGGIRLLRDAAEERQEIFDVGSTGIGQLQHSR